MAYALVLVLFPVVGVVGPITLRAIPTAAADGDSSTFTCNASDCSDGIALVLWALMFILASAQQQSANPVAVPVSEVPPVSSGSSKAPQLPGSPAPGSPVSADVVWRPFAADSAWNTPIGANAVRDPNSAAMVAALTSVPNKVNAALYEYGAPVYEADASTPRVKVTCTMTWGDCMLAHQLVPIPDAAVAATGSDGHLVVIDRAGGMSYELWQARKSTGGWVASWGAVMPLDGDGRSNPVSNNAVGAGISRLAGLVRVSEIRNGYIPHALVFASANTCRNVFRYPATKTDGNSSASNCIPEGARIQLDPSIDVDAIANITPAEKAIAKALQTYGAYVSDTAGTNMAFPFEVPTAEDGPNPYPTAGLAWDYHNMAHIPWARINVISADGGTGPGPDVFPTT